MVHQQFFCWELNAYSSILTHDSPSFTQTSPYFWLKFNLQIGIILFVNPHMLGYNFCNYGFKSTHQLACRCDPLQLYLYTTLLDNSTEQWKLAKQLLAGLCLLKTWYIMFMVYFHGIFHSHLHKITIFPRIFHRQCHKITIFPRIF